MGKYKRLAGDTLLFAIGSLGSKLILFLLVPLYTNYLTTAEYGTAELVYTVANLIMPISSLVIFDAVLRFALDQSVDKSKVILNAGIVFIGGSVFSLLIAPLVGLYPSLSEWKWYVSVYIVSYMSTQISMTYVKAKEQTKTYVVLALSQTLLLAVLNIVLLAVLHMGIYGYLLASILANFGIAISSLFCGGIIKDLKNSSFDKTLFISMVKYSAPLIINNISWWVVQSSDKIMVEFFISSAALGLYTVSSKIPALINVITSIFSQSWGISSIKEYDSTKDTQFYATVFAFFSFAVFFFCACLLLIIKPFMAIYVAEDFFESWKYVPWLLVAAAFSAISAYFGAVYGALKKSVNVMLSTLFSAAINIGLNIVLIPRMGIMGATVATAVAYLFIAVYRMIDTRRYFKFKISFVQMIVNYTAVCISALFITIDMYGPFIACICIAAVAVVNKKELVRLLSVVKKLLGRREKL